MPTLDLYLDAPARGSTTSRPSRILKDLLLVRPLKKVQMQGGVRYGARGVLGSYAAASRERANAADGPFSAAYYEAVQPPSTAIVAPVM